MEEVNQKAVEQYYRTRPVDSPVDSPWERIMVG